jgi:hypothetical protein
MIDGSSFGTARSPIDAIIFIQIQSIDELQFLEFKPTHLGQSPSYNSFFLNDTGTDHLRLVM